jgi:hypothetical protein
MAVAMLVSAGLLLLAQVIIDFGATRYVIFIFPVVASYAAVALGRLRRGRAGHIMLIALLGLIASPKWLGVVQWQCIRGQNGLFMVI